MRIIITDVKYKMTLAPVRSLAERGHEVVCCEYEGTPKKKRLGALSRFCASSASLPQGEEELIPALKRLAESGDRPVLFPSGRRTLDIVARHPELSEAMDYLVSPKEILDKADDKRYAGSLAEKLGIPVPATRFLSEYASLGELAKNVRFPCIIKYRNGEALGLKSRERYAIVRDAAGFEREYSRMDAVQKDPLAQDYLDGGDLGIAVVTDKNADIVDFLCYISERDYPLSGGPTCLCRTIFDRELLRSAAKLMKALGFTGVAMLDFRRAALGDFFLEINPRLWGSAYLCNAADSGFFEAYALAAAGKREPLDIGTCVPGYETGTRVVFTPQAAAALLQEIKRGNLRVILPSLADAFDPRIKDGVFSFRDPRPYFAYLLNLFLRSGDGT